MALNTTLRLVPAGLLAVGVAIWLSIRAFANKTMLARAENGEPEDEHPFGATEIRLRLWLAEEAMRQGELQLASQSISHQSLETRGTASLGWIVTLGVAITAVFFNSSHREWRLPALLSMALLMTAALLIIISLWPRRRKVSGFDPQQLLDMKYATELEVRESLALGMSEAIRLNRARLNQIRRLHQVAWLFFALAPAAGLVILIFS